MPFPVRLATALATITLVLGTGAANAGAANPLGGRGMWIWYVNRSDGGNVGAIIAQSRAAGVRTLFIKSADGASSWSQFNRALVRALHAGGLRACAWQYVYGSHPVAEAAVGAEAVRNGADCLVIDAESEYEGRYASAQTYIGNLRARIGHAYPLGLASFPYVDYHPGFPYSVFLGPGGAQFNLPQMYWRDIGTSVDAVFHHTYTYNRIYRRTIRPLGEVYNGATAGEVQRFRGLTARYQGRGLSWWDYSWTSAGGLWSSLSGLYSVVSDVQPLGYPRLGPASQGDEVLWMQELLARVIPAQAADGAFGPRTLANLEAFQSRRGLPATGRTGPATWRELLRLRPVMASWTAAASSANADGRGGSSRRPASAPRSAGLRALAYEIPRHGAPAEPQRRARP